MALLDLGPPLVEPIDLAYAKSFLRIDTPDEDTLIAELIKAARHHTENSISKTLIRRGFLYRGPLPTSNCVNVPRPPLLSVTRLSLVDTKSQIIDIPPDDYSVNTRGDPGRISLNQGKCLAEYQTDNAGLELEFIAGYGDMPSDIPLPIKQAILLLLAQSYEHRDSADIPPVPMMVDALLMPYRWMRI